MKQDKPSGKNNKKTRTTFSTPKEALDKQKKHYDVYRILGGFALLLLSILLTLAIVSYFFTGREDQNVLQGDAPMSAAHNWLGYIGAWIADIMVCNLFGAATIFVCVLMGATALRLMNLGHVRLWKWFVNCTFLAVWFSVALQFFFFFLNPFLHFPIGGRHGMDTVAALKDAVGTPGTAAILLFTAVLWLFYASRETLVWLSKLSLKMGKGAWNGVKHINGNKDAEETVEETVPETQEEEESNVIEFDVAQESEQKEELELMVTEDAPEEEQTEEKDEVDFEIVPTEEEKPASEESEGMLEPYDPKLDLERYKYPVLELLNSPSYTKPAIDYDEQTQNKDRIIRILKNFGVEITSICATVGPTITLYEIQPAPGIKISKIRNLEDDIALSLSALGIRIIAPIPGKGTIGIEVPNKKPQMVPMESILNSQRFLESDYELPLALGKTITNEVFMVDLAKMPHLLVAGATGMGKSVGLNAIITSLLYKKHPAELKLVMVDPKKVEFSVYSPLVHHFLAQVEDEDEDDAIITDVKKVVSTLNSLCAEMDERYDLLKRCRVRNIKEYNAKFKARQLNPENGHRFLPYIVVIIDEFGDLIMTAGKEVELPIARIAQLARAVGIHMIIATQRPTTNIITGTIKANFPARMAFKVSSMIDSRTILDRPGANQLVGKGDMLFLSGAEPVRVQCAFVDTPEVERICNYVAMQQGYPTSFQLKRVVTEGDDDGVAEVDMKHLDPMFDEIARWVVAAQQGSTSAIQRKFSIGYNRAGRITDQLEAAGIVGPAQGSKPREVLCMSDDELEYKLNNLR